MKIHFIGDLGGNKLDYKMIVDIVKSQGNELVTDHSLVRTLDDVAKESPEDAELYAKKMMWWIKEADIVLVETTVSFLGAGYEISTALQLNKPVIVLYRPDGKNTPHVLKGIGSDKLQVVSYNDKNIQEVLFFALDYAVEKLDTRFTFFIPPSIKSYLDSIVQNSHVSRSEYIRSLIEKDMENKQ